MARHGKSLFGYILLCRVSFNAKAGASGRCVESWVGGGRDGAVPLSQPLSSRLTIAVSATSCRGRESMRNSSGGLSGHLTVYLMHSSDWVKLLVRRCKKFLGLAAPKISRGVDWSLELTIAASTTSTTTTASWVIWDRASQVQYASGTLRQCLTSRVPVSNPIRHMRPRSALTQPHI